MGIRGIKLTWKHPAAIEFSRRVNSTDTRLHCHYMDKWIKIIRLWWLSQWLVSHGRHPVVTIYSDGVSRRVSTPGFWSLGLEGLVSVSKDFSLGLELFVSIPCTGYFSWSFARRRSSKKRFYKMIVQNLAVQRGQWLSFLCCYVVYITFFWFQLDF